MKLLILIFLSLPFVAYTQTTSKYIDKVTGDSVYKFYSEATGIIIQKNCSNTNRTYSLGLIVYRKTNKPDYFMSDGGIIYFDDKTTLSIKETILSNYYQDGKHQFCIRHQLTKSEIELFKVKKIESFSIAGIESDLDKWQKQNIFETFQKMLNE